MSAVPFHNAKIIATMWPSIDKETVLSKVINNIDAFRMNLSHGDEDTKRRYIDIIHKLDSSKTIILDTRGPEIRTKNKDELVYSEWDEIIIEFAEFFKYPEEIDTMLMDYPNMKIVPVWSVMSIDGDAVRVEVKENRDGVLIGNVTKWWVILINRVIEFENYIPSLPFLSEKDKKHIVRWIQNGINVIAVSFVRTHDDLLSVQTFLKEHEWGHVKVIVKIDTPEVITNIEEVVKRCDGIIINRIKLWVVVWDQKQILATKKNLINICNRFGKPVIMTTWFDTSVDVKKDKKTWAIIEEEMALGSDGFMFTRETAVAEEPLEYVMELYEKLNVEEWTRAVSNFSLEDAYVSPDHPITDYIIYQAYAASKNLPIKAILCPSESWYTAARLSALKPDVPIISFTKNDAAFRYMNLLRGVKGYKIASTFDYVNIKQIWKEILRILFKGSISLDDMILIVHSSLEQDTPWMINGMELYRFKNI